MHMKVIRNELDYDVALERLSTLMSAAPGTREFDELEVLGLLVDRYEAEHHAIDLPTPVEAIRFRMEQVGAVQRDLVPFIGSASKVSEVLAGKRPLTLAMVKALNKGFGIPAEVLLQDVSEEKDHGFDATALPWGEMIRRGWVPDFAGTAKDAKAMAGQLVAATFSKPALSCFGAARFRRSVRSGAAMDEGALTAWTARVATVASGRALPSRYKEGTIDAKFMDDLLGLSFMDRGPRLAVEFLAKHGIHLVVEGALPKTRVDGAAALLPDGTPVIGLSLRYDRLDNFWFCLAHELAHVALHLGKNDVGWFVDDLESKGEQDNAEAEADTWAGAVLLPAESAVELARVRTEAQARDLARKLSRSPAIVAGRIRHSRKNYRLLTDLVGQGKVRMHFPECTG